MIKDEMSDEEYLERVRAEREESVRFFQAQNRPERELWVANEFLVNLGVGFQESELEHVTDDPPDVRFRDAEFEIKEILDEGRRRHDEYKTALERARSATSTAELLTEIKPRDITYAEVCDRVEERLTDLADKYSPDARARIDLLFYVNLEDVHGYVATPLPPQDRFARFGYRSVSLVMGRWAGVLMARRDAPAFLRSGAPKLVQRADANA